MTRPLEHHVSDLDGLRIATERVPSVRSVSIGAWMGVGSRDESDDARGYAHFLEHLLFKGNERYGATAISQYFDGIGAEANAATTKEFTVVHTRVLDRHVPTTLDVIGNMVLAPGISEGDLDAEREVILEEIAMYRDSPGDIVHEHADSLVFADHPLGGSILGSEESIASATSDGVRAFHDSHYVPDQIVISAVGNLDHEEFVDAVRQRFLTAAQMNRARPAAVHRLEALPPAVARASIVHKDTEQVHLVLGGRGVARHDPRRYAAAVLDTLLGATPGSRLFTEIREIRGLAYSVYTFLSHFSDTGEFGLYIGVRPDRLDAAAQVLRKELEHACTAEPGQDELARAKDHLEGRMLLAMESTTARSNRLGGSLITNMPIEPVEVTLERVRAVTPGEVRDLASVLLDPSTLSFAAVADDVDAVQNTAVNVLGIQQSAFEQPAAVARKTSVV